MSHDAAPAEAPADKVALQAEFDELLEAIEAKYELFTRKKDSKATAYVAAYGILESMCDAKFQVLPASTQRLLNHWSDILATVFPYAASRLPTYPLLGSPLCTGSVSAGAASQPGAHSAVAAFGGAGGGSHIQ